jgi:ABC-type hemin transport system ATPase subunit/predicted RNA-binding Zn-ribbon protein involved in translation (DUF1610 family)
MRIKAIKLAWFRGAADQVELELNNKSMVVYGENGAGKSSFVDSVEYVLNNGHITHLAHEYSGKHQENAIHNTHKPQGQKTELIFKFEDNSELQTEIMQNGTAKSYSAETIDMNSWNYRRTVLRQDEVSAFVHDTKGDKFSALLPLLGLDELVTTAENLRQLVKSIEVNSKIKETKTLIKAAETKRKQVFSTSTNDQIIKIINELYLKYCLDIKQPKDALAQCKEIELAIQMKSGQVSSDHERYRLLQIISQLKLIDHISDVRIANSRMVGTIEPFIVEKLDVLKTTESFVNKLDNEKEVLCPACGRSIAVDDFQTHIKSEQTRLHEIININNTRKIAIDALCETIQAMKSSISSKDLKSWKDELAVKSYTKNLEYISEINIEALQASCDEENLVLLEDLLLPFIDEASLASTSAPPETQELLADSKLVDGGKVFFESIKLSADALSIETIMSFLCSIEKCIRTEIRNQTETVLKDISIDIQRMWGILHPDNTIKEVCLYIPREEDKAIDISLEFYGKAQPSPRISLSEGYRNSLGLSIFLSMAKRESCKDRPLFLDDVIVSLDRNHRGMVAELLKKEFADRQVIIFTHDRDWYTELRHQLDTNNWIFKTLLPYETPEIGIRWSHKTTTFDDARIHIKKSPDSAGNDARKIMDVELALIAEKLQINFPYLRSEKNDRRMAHDFLERILVNGKKCYQKKVGNSYDVYIEAIEAFNQADSLIVSWGNRASHSFDLVSPEAEKLIEACEKALEYFRCTSCGKNVWFTDAEASEWVQCQCGEIRWRYGKGN